MTKRKSVFAGISAAALSAAAAAVFNVAVMPYGALVYDLAVSDASADVQEYSYYAVSDSPGYGAVEESASEYSEALAEEFSSEELSGTYTVVSVGEEFSSSDAGGTANVNRRQYPAQGNYIVVYDYPTYAYAVATSESGGINSDTVMVITINNNGFEVGRQTQITPVQSRR